jgi:Fur family ferric uptake transcriptional regulator
MKSTASALLKGAGLRTTQPRLRVLEKLAQSTTPVSHGELVEELEHAGVDRTTIYRNLLDLTDAGLVRRTDLGDHVWRFELMLTADKPVEHPHFTCTDCGMVECLPELTVQVPRGRRAPRSIAEHKVEIQLRGLCDDCS